MLKPAVSEQNSWKAFQGIWIKLSGNVGDGVAEETADRATASQQEGLASKNTLVALEFPAP